MERTNSWSHFGEGTMGFTAERAVGGRQSVRLRSLTRTDKPAPVAGRPFGEAVVRREFPGEDWGAFNRLSFHVYPHLPGFHAISLLVRLRNDGVEKSPGAYGREGLNFCALQPDRWNHVVWEIPNVPRDKVTGVEFVYRLQGNEPGAADEVVFDIDQLELQKVQADYYEGWRVAPGGISYCHPGYTTWGSKVAIANVPGARLFKVGKLEVQPAAKRDKNIPAPMPALERVVLTRDVKTDKNLRGEFQILDFSEIHDPGRYVLRVGDRATEPFEIRDDIWTDTIRKSLNVFRSQRCGAEVPGLHGVCHADWRAKSGEKAIAINGGWHDAGDFSQGLVNTAEAVSALYTLAETFRGSDPSLAEDLAREGSWGLEWIRKTSFGDGSRVTWATMDFWTDNRTGTVDDVWGEVRNSPFDNFTAAAAEAIAARSMKELDPSKAQKLLQEAVADWRRALDRTAAPGAELASAATVAALELYKSSGEQAYANKAFELAEVILASQERETQPWSVPLAGFFYSDPKRSKILRYSHRGHNQAPVAALAELCEHFPHHSDWMKWYSAVVLHSEFLKAGAALNSPYDMLPASLCNLDESGDEAWRQQVRRGVKLDEKWFLRSFPVWSDLRGNNGVLLSQARALSAAALLRNDFDSMELAERQLEWVVGRNPFCQSLMFGVGHDFAPQYAALTGDIVGGLPVGIQTRGDSDEPYWPASNCYNYKEVWVHPTSRWLGLMGDMSGPAAISGAIGPDSGSVVEFRELSAGGRFSVKADAKTGKFATHIPQGRYVATHANRQFPLTLLAGQSYEMDLVQPLTFELHSEKGKDGSLTIRIKAEGEGERRFALRASNLQIDQPEKRVKFSFGVSQTVSWTARLVSAKEPWVAVAIPDGNVADRKELFSGFGRK